MNVLRTLNRVVGPVLNGIRSLGVDVTPVLVSPRKIGGVRIQWTSDRPQVTHCLLVEDKILDKPISFVVQNERDLIQGEHFQGKFYEKEELDIISRYFEPGGVFVDIGCNIGNHTIYVVKFLGAQKVIAFEPNRSALRLLKINLVLNEIRDDVVLHEIGLSDKPGNASLTTGKNNLGGARLSATDGGAIRTERGDDVLRGEKVSFIKIDAEGMELAVLEGLRETIKENRPVIFAEVENANIEAFRRFCDSMTYEVAQEYRRYPVNANFLARPAAPR